MRRVLKIPQARFPAPEPRLGRPVAWSLLFHVVMIALLVWRVEADLLHSGRDATGPPGGGGGGGGREVTLVALPPLPDASRRSVEEVPVEPEPQVVPVYSPTVREIIPVEETVTLRTNRPPLRMAQALGSGSGISGGPGSGSGTGGGEGSGQGTGTGSGVGPGSGGEGDVLPPSVRFSALPPMENRPASLRGRSFRVLFTVDPEGRVMDVRTEPRIDESGYRRKFLDAMKRYRFHPAKRRDGTAVIGLATVTVTL